MLILLGLHKNLKTGRKRRKRRERLNVHFFCTTPYLGLLWGTCPSHLPHLQLLMLNYKLRLIQKSKQTGYKAHSAVCLSLHEELQLGVSCHSLEAAVLGVSQEHQSFQKWKSLSSVFYLFLFFCSSGIFFWKQYRDLKVITGLWTASVPQYLPCKHKGLCSILSTKQLQPAQSPFPTPATKCRLFQSCFKMAEIKFLYTLSQYQKSDNGKLMVFDFLSRIFYELLHILLLWTANFELAGSVGQHFLPSWHELDPRTHMVEEKPILASFPLSYTYTCMYVHSHTKCKK